MVVGSIAFDTVTTPAGRVEETLGGSAVYFSYAASFVNPVRLVGVVGEDFAADELRFLEERNVDVAGVCRSPGKTFRWCGLYEGDMAEATTEWVQLNVFESFRPEVPERFRDSEFVFLANGDPQTQLHLLDQLVSPRFVACDTMNHWIDGSREALLKVLRCVNAVVLNEGEARMLTGESNLVKAGRAMQELGPDVVVIKKGHHGAALFSEGNYFVSPAYPVSEVVDPTGAGDSFAGGFMGHLAACGQVAWPGLKEAIVFGTAVASFNVEGFSLEGLRRATVEDVQRRCRELTAFAAV